MKTQTFKIFLNNQNLHKNNPGPQIKLFKIYWQSFSSFDQAWKENHWKKMESNHVHVFIAFPFWKFYIKLLLLYLIWLLQEHVIDLSFTKWVEIYHKYLLLNLKRSNLDYISSKLDLNKNRWHQHKIKTTVFVAVELKKNWKKLLKGFLEQ